MNQKDAKNIVTAYGQYKEKKLYGRYLAFDTIAPLLKQLSKKFAVDHIGTSYHKYPIYTVTVGKGPINVLLWSQMHGNESTGTKALFDLFNFFGNPEAQGTIADEILEACTLTFIPMLNPDGAEAYTRVNAQNIDLNRDAIALKAYESQILNRVLTNINPQFCFNLHDQRTIFSVGEAKHPATLSFLAPSEDEERTVTAGRKVTMAAIVAMKNVLDELIPNQMGRYTDEFYPTATGDNFQKAGHNTILIEAGHIKGDYDREEVRKYNFIALLAGLHFIASETAFENYKAYFKIPNNEKYYLDLIYKNVFLVEKNQKLDVGISYKEVLKKGKVSFEPSIAHTKDLSDYQADEIIDKKGEKFENMQALHDLLKK